MDDMYLFFTNGKYLEGKNYMYQHNYSGSPTLEEAEWEDGDKKEKHSQKCNIYFKWFFDALERSRRLDNLDGYGVGPRDLRLFRRYWEQLQMVAQVGGHYGEPFCQ